MRQVLIAVGVFAATAFAEPTPRLVVQQGHRGAVRAVAFSPDGTLVATGGHDGVTKLWNLADGRMLASFPPGVRVLDLVFTPDGRHVLAGMVNAEAVLWNVRTAEATHRLDLDQGGYCGVDVSRDGTLLAFGGDRRCRIVSAKDGKTVHELVGPQQDRFYDVAFDPKGERLAAASDERTVYLWRVADGTLAGRVTGFEGPVVQVAYAADGTLYARTDDGAVKSFAGADGAVRATGTSSFALGKGGPAFGLETGTVRIGGRAVAGYEGGVLALACSPDGEHFAAGGADGRVHVRESATGRLVRTLAGDRATAPAVAANGRVVFRHADRLAVFDIVARTMVWTAPRPLPGRVGTAFDPTGTFLLVGVADRPVWRVDLATGAERPLGPNPRGPIAIAADGDTVAARVGETEVGLWRRGEHVKPLPGKRSNDIFGLAFSHDGTLLAQGGKGDFVRVLDVASGKALRETAPGAGWVASFAFDRAAARLLCGGPYATLTLRDAKTLEPLRAMPGHVGGIRSVAFSPDETRLLSTGSEGTLRIWDTATGAHLATLHALPGNDWILVATDGRYDASPGAGAFCSWRTGARLQPLPTREPAPDLARRLLR